MEQNVLKKNSSIGAKLWAPIVGFGIVGQLAWVIENMYFAIRHRRLLRRDYPNGHFVGYNGDGVHHFRGRIVRQDRQTQTIHRLRLYHLGRYDNVVCGDQCRI